jgi:hypothetical protein
MILIPYEKKEGERLGNMLFPGIAVRGHDAERYGSHSETLSH